MHMTRVAFEVFNVEQVRVYCALSTAVSKSWPGAGVLGLNPAQARVAAEEVAEAARDKCRSPGSRNHPGRSE